MNARLIDFMHTASRSEAESFANYYRTRGFAVTLDEATDLPFPVFRVTVQTAQEAR